MSRKQSAPCGSWPSPISASLCARARTLVSQPYIADGVEYWVESRPQDEGRSVIVRHGSTGPVDLTPPGFNVRSRVHEYGGGAYIVQRGTVFFSNFVDHRLYRQDPGRPPQPITPEPRASGALRFADPTLSPDGRFLICVREQHRADGEVVNDLVILPSDGSDSPRTLHSGRDFYAAPRLDPQGRTLAWLAWDHPLLPWVGCELWLAEVGADGRLRGARLAAGSADESVTDPQWSRAGVLHFISDRSGWWNLYRLQDGRPQPLAPMEADFAYPQWLFGLTRYAFLSGDRLACVYSRGGFDYLALLQPSGRLDRVDLGLTSFFPPHLVSDGDERLLFVAGGPSLGRSVVRWDVGAPQVKVLRAGLPEGLDPTWFSPPVSISFPTAEGRTAQMLFYRPHHPHLQPAPQEKPPLIVIAHGGPTGAAPSYVDLETQFFTSRGMAVALVNYAGSAGFGRDTREQLKGQWGIVDVEDCIYAARYLVERGEVDGRRMAIRGGSAGGYTTLRALACSNAFSAGVSYYGVADLLAFDAQTHKFESHYNEWLIGPRLSAEAVYRERSPVNLAHCIRAPVLLFQGLDDRIVPPAQAERMVEALRRSRVPHAMISFEGEGHGFRQEETIRRCLKAELSFYGRVFGFSPADSVDTVPIAFL